MSNTSGDFPLPSGGDLPISASPAAGNGLQKSKWPSHTTHPKAPPSGVNANAPDVDKEGLLPSDRFQDDVLANRMDQGQKVSRTLSGPSSSIDDEDHRKGVSEAGDFKSDAIANTQDGVRVAKGSIEAAAIALSGGAAAGASAGAAGATTAGATGAASGAGASAAAGETALAAGASTTGSGAGAAAEASGAASQNILSSTNLNAASDQVSRVDTAKKILESLRPPDVEERKVNRSISREKREQGWSQDHRGGMEKALDKGQSATGVDTISAIEKVPVVGDIVGGSARIKMRADRQAKKSGKSFLTNSAILGAAGLLLLTPLMNSMGAGAVAGAMQDEAICEVSIGEVDPKKIKDTDSVGAYKGDQLRNAAHIMNAATAMKLDRSAQLLGIMTAMGESSLINIDYGDWETNGVRNPDGSPTTSIGLFQQQTSWGSIQDRMDPVKSASLFYERLIKVPNWKTLEPTIAIHEVQINADPYHYQRYQPDGQKILDFVAGIPGGAGAPSGGCPETPTGEWVLPWAADAPGQEIRDGYGWRARHPVTGDRRWHNGYDFGFGEHGDPVLSISAGTVIRSWDSGSCQFQVIIEHKDTSRSQYIHLFRSFVSEGQTVKAGEAIGAQGGSPGMDPRAEGCSSGTHLHLETFENGISVNPGLYLKARGIDLSTWDGWDPDPIDYNGR